MATNVSDIRKYLESAKVRMTSEPANTPMSLRQHQEISLKLMAIQTLLLCDILEAQNTESKVTKAGK